MEDRDLMPVASNATGTKTGTWVTFAGLKDDVRKYPLVQSHWGGVPSTLMLSSGARMVTYRQ